MYDLLMHMLMHKRHRPVKAAIDIIIRTLCAALIHLLTLSVSACSAIRPLVKCLALDA